MHTSQLFEATQITSPRPKEKSEFKKKEKKHVDSTEILFYGKSKYFDL